MNFKAEIYVSVQARLEWEAKMQEETALLKAAIEERERLQREQEEKAREMLMAEQQVIESVK